MAKPSKRKKSKQNKREPHHAEQNHIAGGRDANSSPAPFSGAWVLGIIALIVSAGASGMLVLDHFTGMSAPGCGPGSPCAQAAESVWGSVPLIDWPVSFLGLTYFLAVLIAWIIARGAIGSMIWPVRVGALVSFAYVIIMVVNIQEYLCHWCMVSHVGNFVFLGMAEWTRRSLTSSEHDVTLRPLGHALAGMAAITLVLASWQFAHMRTIEREADRALEESTTEIIHAGDEHIGFSGRYRLGPSEAPIRVVAFTGYQCPECQRFETEMERIVRERDDVSFSVKHYPLNQDCNPNVQTRMHPNACWAARAAEAAGILYGEEGFWTMHHWLVRQRGAFTHPQFTAALREFGFDEGGFMELMTSPKTLELVREDVAEGVALGIQSTPMVFLNGVELRGPHASRRIRDAIERLAAEQPEARTPHADQPLTALGRAIEMWRESDHREIEPGNPARAMGPDDAPVTIHLWGDATHGRTVRADALIRELVQKRDDVRYEYRLFPLHSDCNPAVETDISPQSCFAAKLGAAIADLGGAEAYWQIHEWLMRRGPVLREADLRQAAREVGLDDSTVRELIDDPQISALIEREANEAMRIAERSITPMIFVNGRWLLLWEHDEYDILNTIVEEALR